MIFVSLPSAIKKRMSGAAGMKESVSGDFDNDLSVGMTWEVHSMRVGLSRESQA